MKALVVANWKMNPLTFREAKVLLEKTKQLAMQVKEVSLVVAPPSIYLRELTALARMKTLSFAAQNVHAEPLGAHTGEISVSHIKDAKASYVIIGHAERRAAGESDADIQKKMRAALMAQLTPILCIGESERGSDAAHFTHIREQLRSALPEEAGKRLSRIVIAYEPVWAIGGKTPMRPHDMHEMSIYIRKTVVERFGALGHGVKIIYGGAIDAESAPAMLKEGDVTGLLVGRVSIDAQALKQLLVAIKHA